jgi:hypothetical protein
MRLKTIFNKFSDDIFNDIRERMHRPSAAPTLLCILLTLSWFTASLMLVVAIEKALRGDFDNASVAAWGVAKVCGVVAGVLCLDDVITGWQVAIAGKLERLRKDEQ